MGPGEWQSLEVRLPARDAVIDVIEGENLQMMMMMTEFGFFF